ncbi:Mth938-like domain-containing protein [candidate division KSB1 bacterium]|nr:Mth938-like domain-containing protein [candidate division KSB1 bacterium]
MKIESYNFGSIVINGRHYSNDVIIFPDRVEANWWRRSGHELCLQDLEEVLKENPDTLVVGTGASGLMKILPETKTHLESKGIILIIKNTEEACRTFNQIGDSGRVIAALHLTC